MAQQYRYRVYVARCGQHLAREAPPHAMAGAFDTSPLVEDGDVGLQRVTELVAPLACLQRAPLGVPAESCATARVNQRLVRQQAAIPSGMELGADATGQPEG